MEFKWYNFSSSLWLICNLTIWLLQYTKFISKVFLKLVVVSSPSGHSVTMSSFPVFFYIFISLFNCTMYIWASRKCLEKVCIANLPYVKKHICFLAQPIAFTHYKSTTWLGFSPTPFTNISNLSLNKQILNVVGTAKRFNFCAKF